MLEPFAAGCRLWGLCGEGLRQLCVSVPRLKIKRWQQSITHWTNAAQSIRSFMKMKYLSILIPKSVRTGNCSGSKNEGSRRNKMKNILWTWRCTAGQVKSAVWAPTAKSSALFIRLLKRLKATYCRTKTITLLGDNYIIHKGRETQRWLKDKPKCRVIYQPV